MFVEWLNDFTTNGWDSCVSQGFFHEEIVKNLNRINRETHPLQNSGFLLSPKGFILAYQEATKSTLSHLGGQPLGVARGGQSLGRTSTPPLTWLKQANLGERNSQAYKSKDSQAHPCLPLSPAGPTRDALWGGRREQGAQPTSPLHPLCSVEQSESHFSNAPRPTWKPKQAATLPCERLSGCL